MTDKWSRRKVLLGFPVLWLAGCIDRDGSEMSLDGSTWTKTQTSTQTATTTPTSDTQSMIDRLPEPSPLGTVLTELVLAEDRDGFASEHGIALRNGTTKVELELKGGGDLPRDLLAEVDSEYGTMAVAWVRVGSLVDVALSEDVRAVKHYSEPMAHN